MPSYFRHQAVMDLFVFRSTPKLRVQVPSLILSGFFLSSTTIRLATAQGSRRFRSPAMRL